MGTKNSSLESITSTEMAKPELNTFLSPARYKTFALVMSAVGRAGTSALDAALTPSFAVLTALTLGGADGRKLHLTGEALQSSPSRKGKGGRHYDFYRDSRVEDVSRLFLDF